MREGNPVCSYCAGRPEFSVAYAGGVFTFRCTREACGRLTQTGKSPNYAVDEMIEEAA